MSDVISDDVVDLLRKPLYASLGTVRPDHTVQVNPMWYELDGDTVRFTHTTKRAKYRNLQENPAMSLMVTYPDNPFRYVELRGALAEVVPDPTGSFYVRLGQRYGNPGTPQPPDAADRVILVMRVDRVIEG